MTEQQKYLTATKSIPECHSYSSEISHLRVRMERDLNNAHKCRGMIETLMDHVTWHHTKIYKGDFLLSYLVRVDNYSIVK